MKKNIRNLENMPPNIKFIYSKILSLMTFINDNYNQLKIAEFYRIINKIQLPSSNRIDLMSIIIEKEMDFDQISIQIDLDEDLDDQEKNIFRFSLIKDLIIIMKSDYIETEDEKKLLKNIQNHFNISNEQLSFFYEEYELDRCFFDNNISDSKFKKTTQKIVSTATALGIPLTVIYCSGNFKGLGFLGAISGLRTLGMKRKTGKYSLILGVSTSIALGIVTYKSIEYILHIRKDEKTKLAHLMKENMEVLHETTKHSLYNDIEYFSHRTIDVEYENEKELDNSLRLINILKSAVATLENTEAVIV